MGPFARTIGTLALGVAFSTGARADRHVCAEAGNAAGADRSRAAEVRALLAGTADGTRLAATGRAPDVCFTNGEGGITPDGIAILDRAAPPREEAARLAHLWQHALDRAPRAAPAAGESCDAWLREVESAEARGDEIEARVAAALGLALRSDKRAARSDAYRVRCR